MPAKKRRARKKSPRGVTRARSIRFSDEEWADIEKKAHRFGISPSTATRQQALAWARSPT